MTQAVLEKTTAADENLMTGAEMVVRALVDNGVKHIFGTSRTPSSTSWSAMSKVRVTWRKAMRAPPARPASCW
jgi:hypothetical protein